MEPPIFIVGHPRSGTSWLTACLAEHPRLASSGESHLFNLYLKEFYQSSELWLVDHWIGRDQLNASLKVLVCTIFESLLTRTGKQRVLEKTPTHRDWLPQIFEMFPQSKIVHLYRDGRDVALSMMERKRKTNEAWIPSDVGALAQRWVDVMKKMKEDQQRIGVSHFLSVRYETLIDGAHAGVRHILDFVGEHSEKATIDRLLHLNPPRADRMGRWQKELSEEEKKTYNSIAKEELLTHGYAV